MTEAIKLEILKRRDDALFKREAVLEEYRHGKRTAAEEKTYQRRREEEGIEYKGRREKEQEEYESRLTAKGKEPSAEEKKYEFYVKTFGKEEALKLIRGKSDKLTTTQLNTLKYAAGLVLEGKSAEEVNAVLEAAGIEERYVEYETGEEVPIEGTGIWGFFQDKEKEKGLRLESGGLLGGASPEPAGAVSHAEPSPKAGKSPFADDETKPESNTFDELKSKIGPDETTQPIKDIGLLEKKQPIKRTKMVGSSPEDIKAEKEAGKQELIALANKMGVGAKNWKAFYNLNKDIIKWLWGSYDMWIGDMLRTQKATRESFGK